MGHELSSSTTATALMGFLWITLCLGFGAGVADTQGATLAAITGGTTGAGGAASTATGTGFGGFGGSGRSVEHPSSRTNPKSARMSQECTLWGRSASATCVQA